MVIVLVDVWVKRLTGRVQHLRRRTMRRGTPMVWWGIGTCLKWPVCLKVRPLHPLVSVVGSFTWILSTHSRCFIFFTFSRIYFWILSTTAPTSSYSVRICSCIQRGSFQVGHCGGDEHGIKYVHSTLFCLLLLLSLEFLSTHSRCFFTFSSFLRQWLQTNIVRRCLVVFDGFQQRIW